MVLYSYDDKERGTNVAKAQLPLTETVFYIMLTFQQPTYGYLAIQSIEELSQGKVRIAAGTMYGALENLLKQKMIEQVPSSLERRKMYKTTAYGNQVLTLEVERMKHCLSVWEQMEGGCKDGN